MYQLICQQCTTEGFTLFFISLHFIFVPECHVWYNRTYWTPVQRWYSPTRCMYSGLSRANSYSTCQSSQSIRLSWPLGRDILCASLSLYRVFSAVRLVNITVSFSLQLHQGWQQSIQTHHHAIFSEEKMGWSLIHSKTSTQKPDTLELWKASFKA